MAFVRRSINEGDKIMTLVPFDDWKSECELEPIDCEECDGDGYVECWHCDNSSECNSCIDGLIDPDYPGEYLRHLKATMKKLISCMTVTMTYKKSIIKLVKSDSRLASRYNSMRIELRKNTV